eukprot:9493768-Pyramimonas_sp.AAC.3
MPSHPAVLWPLLLFPQQRDVALHVLLLLLCQARYARSPIGRLVDEQVQGRRLALLRTLRECHICSIQDPAANADHIDPGARLGQVAMGRVDLPDLLRGCQTI